MSLCAEMWVALCCIKVCEHTSVKGAYVNVPLVARPTLGEHVSLFLCKLSLSSKVSFYMSMHVYVCACVRLLACTVTHSFFKNSSLLAEAVSSNEKIRSSILEVAAFMIQ